MRYSIGETHLLYWHNVHGTTKAEVVEKLMAERDMVIHEARENLKKAQNRMKFFFDKKHVDSNFEVDDWVYLKLYHSANKL